MTATLTRPIERKDDRAPTASDYRRLLLDARRTQLQMTRANVERLARTYDAAAQSIADKLTNLPGYMLGPGRTLQQAYYRVLLADLDRTILALWSDYGKVLNLACLDLAQAAAEREAAVEAMAPGAAPKDPRLLADLSRSEMVSTGARVTVEFGRVAQSAVEATANRVYRDGLRLSQRLYNLDAMSRRTVENVLLQGIAEQVSADKLAGRLQDALAATGRQTPRYNAMRIARTEINNAHREGHLRSLYTEDGVLKPHVRGARWNLSLSHPEADICDAWAAHDEGLGAGVYRPESAPVDHPHGLCYVTTELIAIPGVRGPGKAAHVDDVPQSQLAYYAAQGDAPAIAALAGRS